MEKDIGKIAKNSSTDIVVRVDAYGGKPGVTIREFVNESPSGYKGFTKSGTRIPAEKFLEFREMINTISLEDLKADPNAAATSAPKKEANTSVEDY